MKTATCSIVGLSLGVLLTFQPNTINARQSPTLTYMSSFGLSRGGGNTGFNQAFGTGHFVGMAFSYSKSDWWRVWLEGDYHEFDYDRNRFFTLIGLGTGDLSGQLGAGAQAYTVSVGLTFNPWRLGPFTPFSRIGVGYFGYRNGSTRLFMWMYCDSWSEEFVQPAGCTDARAEVPPGRSTLGFRTDVGLAIQMPESIRLVGEIGIRRAWNSGAVLLMPLRVGLEIQGPRRK